MSSTTKNLGLFKYDTDIDIDEVFSIEQALNDNWDIIDSAIPTKTSQLVNDSGFLTSHQSLADYVKKSAANTVSGATTFTGTTKVPNSATVGTAVSTAAISKAANGYVKFGNGVQICWGTGSMKNGDTTITFPSAFASTARVAMTKVRSNNGRSEDWWITSQSKTSFKPRSSETDSLSYIAIGY